MGIASLGALTRSKDELRSSLELHQSVSGDDRDCYRKGQRAKFKYRTGYKVAPQVKNPSAKNKRFMIYISKKLKISSSVDQSVANRIVD